jgi:predicted transcriptional regulator
VRLSVALLLSVRPRTLSELAESTGGSIQAVLKHTKKIEEEGLLAETILGTGRYLRRRKLYSMKNKGVEGFARGDVLVAAFTPREREGRGAEDTKGPNSGYPLLESLAEDVIYSRANMRESIKKLDRAISRVAESQDRLARTISEQHSLTGEEKHIAYLYFTEDSESKVKEVLKTHFGCADPGDALGAVLTKLGGK